jgi:hypothetical protein
VGVNKMTGLVLELQRDALNPEIKVSNLLRKAIVISKKLGIVESEEWLNKELEGYLTTDKIPKYRTMHGEVKIFNPYRGWQPVHFEDSDDAEEYSKREISQKIGELEFLSESDSSRLQIPFSQHIANRLMASIGFPLKPTLVTDKTGIIGILEAVRKKVLDWSLELEQQGILGDGMSFSPEEKKLAHQTSYQITNHIGNMHNSQLQQDSASATQSLTVTETNTTELKNFIEELKKAMDSLQLAQEQSQELNEAIAMLEIQVNSAKPNNVIIRESGLTVRNVLEGMTGSIIASGLIYKLGLFLPV